MWTLATAASIPMWRPPASEPDAILAFTTRRGGTSAPPFDSLNVGRSTDDDPERVTENRVRALSSLGLDPARLATASQVHGATVTEVDRPGLHPATDALLTRAPGLALAVTVADCLPIILTAPGVVAVVHSGWRGIAADMPRAALEAVIERAGEPPGAAREAVRAHLGPAIGPCCYRVGPDVAERFPDSVVRRVDHALHLDLRAAARAQLIDSGVRPDAITSVEACTACDSSWYFSHRRDAGQSGRQWAIAALRT